MEHILTHSMPGNPRTSEGSFVKLSDGTLYFAFSRYSGSSSADHAAADVAAVTSKDNGTTWSKPFIVLKNKALNLMSVSLLRLNKGQIAMTYLEKSAVPGKENFVDCRPKIVFSADECKTWSEPTEITDIPAAYFVVNNDRLVQLKNGRLILPAAHHQYLDKGGLGAGIIKFFLSDDNGKTWNLSKDFIYPGQDFVRGMMEPGVIELNNGNIMCFIRTGKGSQYKSFSNDNGNSWTPAVPAPEFTSPESPMSLKRNPANGKLYAVWNDHSDPAKIPNEGMMWKRSPLVMAESSDEGKTWKNHRILENEKDYSYCYIAILFNGPLLHLGYCCGGKISCDNPLQDTKLRTIKLD